MPDVARRARRAAGRAAAVRGSFFGDDPVAGCWAGRSWPRTAAPRSGCSRATISSRVALGRGGGQRDPRHAADQRSRSIDQAEVVGAEVVAPLGDAVRLVDGEQRDPAARRAARRTAARVTSASGATYSRSSSPATKPRSTRAAGRRVLGGVEEPGPDAEPPSARRPGPASARSAARPPRRRRRGPGPGSGSTATCRRRWASAPGRRRRPTTWSMISCWRRGRLS